MSKANDIYTKYDKQQRTAFVSEETYRHEVELHQAAITENATLRKELERTRAMAQFDVQELQDKLQKELERIDAERSAVKEYEAERRQSIEIDTTVSALRKELDAANQEIERQREINKTIAANVAKGTCDGMQELLDAANQRAAQAEELVLRMYNGDESAYTEASEKYGGSK